MSVEFKEAIKMSSNRHNGIKKNSAMVNALIRMGIVKSVRGANIVLIAVIILCSTIAVWFYWQSSSDEQTLYREDIPDKLLDQIPDEQLRKIPTRN